MACLHFIWLHIHVDRIFLTELNGNPNKKNSRDETCLQILCSVPSPSSNADLENRLFCVDLLLNWSRPPDQTGGDEEKLDLAAVDEVNFLFCLEKNVHMLLHIVMS